MLFNSYIFIFLFLPLCLAGFYGLKTKQATLAKVWLTCFSLWFYGYFNPSYLGIMLASIFVNFVFHCWIHKEKGENISEKCFSGKRCGRAKAILTAGVMMNLLVLFYFKYFNFFLDNVNQIFGLKLPLKSILLPLGISFFTFQQISFLADTYRGELEVCSFVDYALFVSFFPQLIAGPIVTHEEMLPQFAAIGRDNRTKEERTELFARGVYLFVLGLAKKVLIADTFGKAVDYAYSNVGNLNGLESLITILFYSLQLYYDFSGYCDMARGIAGMFGMDLPINFNSPYKATNIVDFWKRWHITLSRFLTKNVYIPLGGNRRGMRRMYINLLLVFFLSGLWHGAGWNFILWGMLHGGLYVITRWWQKRNVGRCTGEPIAKENENRRLGKVKDGFNAMLTFIYVNLAWVYFRAESVAQGNQLISQVIHKPWGMPGEKMLEAFNLGEFWYALKLAGITKLPYSKRYLIIAFTLVVLIYTFFGRNAAELAKTSKLRVGSAAVLSVLFIWCVVSLSGVSTFLYFNF